jgi:hypothetical protein
MTYSTFKYLLIFQSLLILTACGSGSVSSSSNVSKKGIFLDSEIEGIEFKTNTLSGTTNSKGEFEYHDGEEVTFSMYGQELSKVHGYNILTPFDNPDTTVHPNYALNLMRLLQTLDMDGDPSNGIKLPAVNTTMNLNFDQNLADFENDVNVLAFISANSNVTTLTVSLEDAIAHFQNTLNSLKDDYSLELEGKTAVDLISTSYCSNNTTTQMQFEFTSTGLGYSGSDALNFNSSTAPISCTPVTPSSGSEPYINLTNEFPLYCAPSCSYKELNRVSTGTDSDGRKFVTSVWHVPNSKVVTSIKRILSDGNTDNLFSTIGEHSYKEVITLK